MHDSNAFVTVCAELDDLGAGIQALRESGFDLQNVSVLAPGDANPGETVAYYQLPGRIGCWGKSGHVWTRLLGVLFGWAYVSLPEFGPVMVAGPLAMWIIGALDNAPLFAELTAVGAGLYSIGVCRARIMRCEAALKRGMYLMVVHGAAADVFRAKTVLQDRRRVAPPGKIADTVDQPRT